MSGSDCSATIIGWGAYTPSHILTNEDLEKIVDTSDEWITSRTGIKRRHVVANSGEATSDLCTKAAEAALKDANMSPQDLDLIIIGTVTPDMRTPSAAVLVQNRLGAFNAAAMDVNAACVGFLYSLTVAKGFILSNMYRNILVLGAETLTSITNYKDRGTCVLFGDGAGAAVVTRSDEPDKGILATHIASAGQHADLLKVPSGGSRLKITTENIDNGLQYLHMNGSEIFKLAVRSMADASLKVIEKAGLQLKDIDVLIPHQANIRIINSLGKRLQVDPEKVIVNIEEYGNTSSASIPLATTGAREQGKIKPGDLGLMVSFGGGLVWGAVLVRF